jgi:hypothetical protein
LEPAPAGQGWLSTPIELLLPSGAVPSFEPAVVSTRPGSWTLFTFDLKGNLWAAEGDPDGKIVTPWVVVLSLAWAASGRNPVRP